MVYCQKGGGGGEYPWGTPSPPNTLWLGLLASSLIFLPAVPPASLVQIQPEPLHWPPFLQIFRSNLPLGQSLAQFWPTSIWGQAPPIFEGGSASLPSSLFHQGKGKAGWRHPENLTLRIRGNGKIWNLAVICVLHHVFSCCLVRPQPHPLRCVKSGNIDKAIGRLKNIQCPTYDICFIESWLCQRFSRDQIGCMMTNLMLLSWVLWQSQPLGR